MIQRIRYPDGSIHDIDRGPGPVGSTITVYQRAIGAVQLSQAIAPDIRLSDPKMAARKRRWRVRKAAA
jgi:hypothetical protein